jgi:energy-coupling factor transport system permease protein
MRSPLAYTPRTGALDGASALAVTAYLGSFALVAFLFQSPIVLAGAGGAVVVAGCAAGARDALWLAARWGLALAVVFVAVNAITAQRGETILIRGGEVPLLGRIDVSAEALAEGAVLAMRVVAVMMAFAVQTAIVDPDRLLRLLRPVARHSALTATLLVRLVPVAAADHARLREAGALRGPAAAPLTRGAMARRLVAGSLDRAVDVAATLELRGYALGPPRTPGWRAPSRRGARFGLVALAVVVLGLAARATGAGGFDAYPLVELDASLGTLLFAAALPLLAWLPFAHRPVRHA